MKQLLCGSSERPEQPPLAEGAGRLSAAGDGSLHLGRAWGRGRGEGQGDSGGRGARVGAAVRARAAGRGPPVVAIDAPERAAAPAAPALAA